MYTILAIQSLLIKYESIFISVLHYIKYACFTDFLHRNCMCKTNMKIKDSCEVNHSQNAERRNLRCSFKKNKMISKSTHGCLTFLLINAGCSEAC